MFIIIIKGGGSVAQDKLTDKQEAFAQGIAAGMGQAEAYKAAYDTKNMASKTIDEKACRLRREGKITARIKELKRETENAAIWTRQDALEMLLRTATEAEASVREPIMNDQKQLVGYRYNSGAGGVIIKAVEAAAKMCGYNEPDKADITIQTIEDYLKNGETEY